MIFVIKLTLLQNYTYFITPNLYFIKTHINIIIFDTFDRTVLRDLRISPNIKENTMTPTHLFYYYQLFRPIDFFPFAGPLN